MMPISTCNSTQAAMFGKNSMWNKQQHQPHTAYSRQKNRTKKHCLSTPQNSTNFYVIKRCCQTVDRQHDMCKSKSAFDSFFRLFAHIFFVCVVFYHSTSTSEIPTKYNYIYLNALYTHFKENSKIYYTDKFKRTRCTSQNSLSNWFVFNEVILFSFYFNALLVSHPYHFETFDCCSFFSLPTSKALFSFAIICEMVLTGGRML